MTMSDIHNEIITKPELNFWIPIITTALLVAASWFNLSIRVELLAQKTDLLIEQNKTLIAKYGDVERRYGEMSTKVTTLQAQHSFIEKRLGI